MKRLFISAVMFFTGLFGYAQTFVTQDSTIAYTFDNDTVWVDEIGNEGDGFIIKDKQIITQNDKVVCGTIYAVKPSIFENDIDDITISFYLYDKDAVFRINGENVYVKRVK